MRIRRTAAGFILLGLTIALGSCTAPTPDADPTGSPPTDAPATGCPEGTSDDGGLCVADTDEAAASAEVVHSIFESESLGSVIIGIWRDGEPVLVGALGESLTGVPATVDMHHRTGNVGHGIITTLLLQQVEAGVLSLEDPVTKYFPDLPLADVTLDMLAHSTSGIAHYTVIPEFQETFYENPFAHLTPEQLIAFGVDLWAAVRTGHELELLRHEYRAARPRARGGHRQDGRRTRARGHLRPARHGRHHVVRDRRPGRPGAALLHRRTRRVGGGDLLGSVVDVVRRRMGIEPGRPESLDRSARHWRTRHG